MCWLTNICRHHTCGASGWLTSFARGLKVKVVLNNSTLPSHTEVLHVLALRISHRWQQVKLWPNDSPKPTIFFLDFKVSGTYSVYYTQAGKSTYRHLKVALNKNYVWLVLFLSLFPVNCSFIFITMQQQLSSIWNALKHRHISIGPKINISRWRDRPIRLRFNYAHVKQLAKAATCPGCIPPVAQCRLG